MSLIRVKFSKIKNAKLDTLSEQHFLKYFKDIQPSEVAFLCYYNKSFPKKYCPKNWKFTRSLDHSFEYTFPERLQYNIFLALNGYSIIPLGYIYGLMVSSLLFLKSKNKEQKISSNKRIDYSSPKSIEGYHVSLGYENNVKKKLTLRKNKKTGMINKEDATKLLELFDSLNKIKPSTWVEMEELPLLRDLETSMLRKK